MTRNYPWWLWLNVLSLDAPLVAVIWQLFLADQAGVRVPIETSLTLAMTVWALYLIDRLLDASGKQVPRTDRHRFARSHPQIISRLAGLALYLGTTTAFLLPQRHLLIGAAIAVLALAYFAAVHLLPGQAHFVGLKEICVSLVFAGGTAIPVIAANPRIGNQSISAIAAFAGLCYANCLSISHWEDDLTGGGLVVTIFVVEVFTAIVALQASWPAARVILCSLALLALLDLIRSHLSRRSLRVLADAVLLTPLVTLVRL